jgi:DhnA family fructose-bisphosphate aldolase class Ia
MDGKQRRLSRLIGADGRFAILAMDHALTLGPIGRLAAMGSLVAELIQEGPDALVVHRGVAMRCVPASRATGLVVHLSGNTTMSAEPYLKTPVASVDSALTLGADAVSVHVTLGCGTDADRQSLRDLGAVSDACQRLGMPLLVMTYLTAQHSRPSSYAHAARVAAEMGADVVKTAHPGTPDALADLIAGCFAPVVVAGGEADGDLAKYLLQIRDLLDLGAAGVCVGRRVFDARSPRRALRKVIDAVHGAGAGIAVGDGLDGDPAELRPAARHFMPMEVSQDA